jgi:hypothetical protein
MKNKVDYIYEYSDLNLFQTRVKILTGDYAGIILEFGRSVLVQVNGTPGGKFDFDYTLYEKPEHLDNVSLIGNREFEEYLSTLLINIINDKKFDPEERKKQIAIAQSNSIFVGEIKIDKSFYPE